MKTHKDKTHGSHYILLYNMMYYMSAEESSAYTEIYNQYIDFFLIIKNKTGDTSDKSN